MDFMTSFVSVALLVAMAVPGFVLRKTKLLGESATGALVAVLLYVAQPLLIISSFFKKAYEPQLLAGMGWVLLFTVVSLFAVYGIAQLVYCKRRNETGRLTPSARACVVAATISNCSFMGIPVLQAMFPGDPVPVMYSAVFNVPFQIFCWTVVVYAITGEKKHISLKRALLNPPTVALVVALPIFFIGCTVPAQIMTAVDFLGNMTTPLSMIVMGVRLAEIRPKELFTSVEAYVSCGLRLVVSPLLTLGLMLLIDLLVPIGSLVIASMYVMTAMPAAASTLMFCEKYDGDSKTAVKCMLLSNVLCIVTIPVLLLLL